MSDQPSNLQEFGASFRQFLDQVAVRAPTCEPFFRRRIREHFGAEPATLATVQDEFSKADQANVQLGLDAFLSASGPIWEMYGLGVGEQARHMGLRLADLVSSSGIGASVEPAPVQHVNVAIGPDRLIPCVDCALYLVRDEAHPLAILLGSHSAGSKGRTVTVETMARTRQDAEGFLAALRGVMRRRNVYRGQVVSLSLDEHHGLGAEFRHLPSIERGDIVLPEGVLERIERSAIRFSQHRERLLAAGRHLKRGILLHGPPGTGKTFTAMHLAGRMSDRTVLVVAGRSQGLLAQACAMARMLQPSTVILEDVDLIAEERTHRDSSLLFELLNQMDGLNEDADILFLLTTNRPEILEPALAARPGRVDLAVEIPLPDADCRRRLVGLYGKGLRLRINLARLVARPDGVSAAFIRELLRLSAVIAAEDGPELVVADRHVHEALRELLLEGGELTRSLLGARRHEAKEAIA